MLGGRVGIYVEVSYALELQVTEGFLLGSKRLYVAVC
jgi:hypothetical protein